MINLSARYYKKFLANQIQGYLTESYTMNKWDCSRDAGLFQNSQINQCDIPY